MATLVMSAAGSQLARTTIGERRSSFRRLKKMLFSATLTRDPSRLSALQLHAAVVDRCLKRSF